MNKMLLISVLIFTVGCNGCKTSRGGTRGTENSGFADYIPWWVGNTNVVTETNTNITINVGGKQ